MQTTFSYNHRNSSKSDSFSSETTPLDEQFNSLSNLMTTFETIGIIFLVSNLSALESIVFVFFSCPQLCPPTTCQSGAARANLEWHVTFNANLLSPLVRQPTPSPKPA